MNEAETRAEHIDPALKAAGWGVVEGSRIRREYPIAPGRIEGHGRRGKTAHGGLRAGVTLNADDFPGGSSPNNFGWISFSTPYQYQGGDLLIEVAYQGFLAGRDADAVYPFTANLAQTAFGNGYNSTTADAGLYAEALVMGFSITSVFVPIPEPSAFFMIGVGFFLLVFRPSRKNLW